MQHYFCEPIGQGLYGENAGGIFSVRESLGMLSLYLEMSERGGHTQRVGEYCKRGVQWILSNWNSEIPPIIGVAGCSMDFCHLPACPWCRQLGAPSCILGRNGVIRAYYKVH